MTRSRWTEDVCRWCSKKHSEHTWMCDQCAKDLGMNQYGMSSTSCGCKYTGGMSPSRSLRCKSKVVAGAEGVEMNKPGRHLRLVKR